MKKIFFLLLIFLILELFIRVTMPIYSERYIYETKNKNQINMFGINIFNKEIGKDDFSLTIRDSKIEKNLNDKKIIIDLIGDSVSKGYGLRYQDTFFSISENILNELNYNLSIVPYALSGTNLINNFDSFKKFFYKNYETKKRLLIYQFNYNDIVPLNDSKIRWQSEELSLFQKAIIFSGKFRYKYLNKSSLLSFIQFNLGKIKYKKNSTCEKRKKFALGPYSYAYGAIGFEKESQEEWNKLEKKTGKITANKLNNAHFMTLKSCGLSRQKITYLKSLSIAFINKDIDPKKWSNLSDEKIISELIKVKGIGRWTAEMYLIFNLCRPDIFPADDLGLIKGICNCYNLHYPITKEHATKLSNRWKPWRSVATWYFWRSLDPIPVEY